MKTEPALIVAGVVALIAVLVQFGVPITEGQSVAIEDFLTIVIPLLVSGIVTRQLVVSPHTVEEKYNVKPGVEPTEVLGQDIR